VLSIDLAASPKRETGTAKGNGKVVLGTVFSDKDIRDWAEGEGLVGIDAPLSLPEGRESIDQRGPHFRECDLELRRRRIPFFPITLGPMRALTKRGMALAEELRSSGTEVVELFPGASRDVMGLGRRESVEGFFPTLPRPKNIHEADALVGLFTLKLYREGMAHTLTGKDGEIVMAKPSLSLGAVKEASFVERKNRFTVVLELEGKRVEAFLRDTAKMPEYVEKGLTYLIERKEGGKLRWLVRGVKWKGRIVPLDSWLDEEMAKLWLRFEGKRAEKGPLIEGSRIDLRVGGKLVEVKGAHLFKDGKAYFPDTPSGRAVRHAKLLAERGGEMIFVSHLPVEAVRIKDPELAEVLEKGVKEGKLRLRGIATKAFLWHSALYWTALREVPVLL